MIKAKGKKIIPVHFKTEEEFLITKAGIGLADKLYVVNARPMNEKTQKIIDYADLTNKKYKIFDDVMELR
jgi:hypothetical protein